MGAAGVDRLGDVLLQQLSRYPLSVFDRRIDVPTAICVVLIDEAHERHFLFQPGQNLALRYEDLDEAVIRDSAFVSVGGAMALPELDGEGLLKLFTLAHASGARTALDMRVSEREYDHALLEACFRKTDYFLLSEREAVWLTGETGSPEKMAQALHKMGAANCVIKLGAQGCYVSADGIEAHIPVFPCRCVDTTARAIRSSARSCMQSHRAGIRWRAPDSPARPGLSLSSMSAPTLPSAARIRSWPG